MQPLSASLKEFGNAIEQGKTLSTNTQTGEWQIAPPSFFPCWRTSPNDLEVASFFQKFLKQLEGSTPKERAGFLKNTSSFQEIASVSAIIEKKLMSKIPTHKKEISPYTKAWIEMRRATIALSYRPLTQTFIHTFKKEGDASLYHEHFQKLILTLQEWKKKKHPEKEVIIQSTEKEMIERLCSFPEFVELLFTPYAKPLFEEFLDSVFEYSGGMWKEAIDVYVQLPYTQKHIARAMLDMKMHRFGNRALRFVEKEDTKEDRSLKKEVYLFVNGEYHSLSFLSKEVSISATEKRPLWNILKSFREQNDRIIDLTYSKNGAIKCDPFEISRLCSEKRWYKNLPEFETLTQTEVERLYCNGKPVSAHAFLVIQANRTTKDLSPDGTHAWCKVIFPQGDDFYRVIAPGKFARYFPPKTLDSLSNLIQVLLFVFQTHPAIIHPFDPNETNRARELVSITLPLTETHFDRAMTFLQNTFLSVHSNSLIFQGQGDNCAQFIQDLLQATFPEENIPNLFEIRLSEAVLPFSLQRVARILDRVPTQIGQIFVRTIIGVFLGAAQGIPIRKEEKQITRRLIHHPAFISGKLAMPAILFERAHDFNRFIDAKYKK